MIDARRPAARGVAFTALEILAVVFALHGAAAADDGGGPQPFSHAPVRLADRTLWVASSGGEVELGDPVAYCLSCHGEEAAERDATRTGHPAAAAQLDHPVDVLYPQADPGYRPPGELAPAVLLLDRRVTCLSCHASGDPRHALVLATERSELCRACHLT